MPEQTSTIISKVWSLCNPFRDDGVSDGDYLGQFVSLHQADAVGQNVLNQTFEGRF